MNDPIPRPPITVMPSSRPRHNLPVQRLPLVGRERELAEAVALLRRPEVGLLTLTGAGGSGKTRLALAIAMELLDGYQDGIWFVSLAPLTDPDLVASTIAQVMGVREDDGRSPHERLLGYVEERELLLVLDNFEHLLTAAPLVAEWLAASPGLVVLATSRASLRLTGEYEYPVTPLTLPQVGTPTQEEAAHSPAVELFCQRAQAVRPDFTLTDENAADVAAVCRRLDGLPLALELAAPGVKLLSLKALLARLNQRLTPLAGVARDVPARQQTLRDTIGWSYDLLPPNEQTLFRRLAVFAGGCTLAAVEAVCDADGDLGAEIVNALASLVDQSLLTLDPHAAGEPRFIMLETIQEFAREQLDASAEAEHMRRRHAVHFVTFAEALTRRHSEAETDSAMASLTVERPNIRAALRRLVECDEGLLAARLVEALDIRWFRQGQLNEGFRWAEELLALPSLAGSSSARSLLLRFAGTFTYYQGRLEAAEALLQESAKIARLCEDTYALSRAMTMLGVVCMERDPVAARAALEAGVAYASPTDAPGARAVALCNLAKLVSAEGDADRARTMLDEALVLARGRSHRDHLALVLNRLGEVNAHHGDLEAATNAYHEAIEVHRTGVDEVGLAATLADSGLVLLRRRDTYAAAVQAAESLDLCERMGASGMTADTVELLAAIGRYSGRPETAARLLGAMAALRSAQSIPREAAHARAFDSLLASTHAALGEHAFQAAWQAGQALTVWAAADEARLLARSIISAAPQAASSDAGRRMRPPVRVSTDDRAAAAAVDLTRRETEIVRLIATGQSNREIAEALVLSVRTVERHIENLYAKLGVHGQAARAAVASYAARHGLG